jgi:hypothetical protein
VAVTVFRLHRTSAGALMEMPETNVTIGGLAGKLAGEAVRYVDLFIRY